MFHVEHEQLKIQKKCSTGDNVPRGTFFYGILKKEVLYCRKDAKKRFNVADASNILEVISNELSEIVADNSSRVNSKGVTKTDSNNNNENFFIGEDYFKQQPDSDKNRYFCKLKKCVSDEGGTKFIEFINWLAKEGYIENTSETKATFAFRLTGICPPKKIVEKVEWKEKATYLFYIIKKVFISHYINSKGRKQYFRGTTLIMHK